MIALADAAQEKKKKESFKPPTEVGLGVTKITKRFKMPKSEQELVEGVQSLGFFGGVRKLKRHNQLLFGLLVSAAIILYWRGLWWLYDLFWSYVLPEHHLTGAVASILLGLFILVGLDYAVRGLVRG